MDIVLRKYSLVTPKNKRVDYRKLYDLLSLKFGLNSSLVKKEFVRSNCQRQFPSC